MKIFVKVKTRAKEEKIEKASENNYVVSVKEQPKKGLANKAVIRILGRSGFSSRKKSIKIYGRKQ